MEIKIPDCIPPLPFLFDVYKFAHNAHDGQVREYTGEPYINHPIEVAKTVMLYYSSGPPHYYGGTPVLVIAACLLHSVVEKTHVTFEEIETKYGKDTSDFVYELTDKSTPADGDRATRNEINRLWLSYANYDVQTIKYADIINNVKFIQKHDPTFCEIYKQECLVLLDSMDNGHHYLRKVAYNVIKNPVPNNIINFLTSSSPDSPKLSALRSINDKSL